MEEGKEKLLVDVHLLPLNLDLQKDNQREVLNVKTNLF